MIVAAGDWIARHRSELELSLRIAVAGLLAFAAGQLIAVTQVSGQLIAVTQVYWAVLTAIIVMQASVGGSLKATFERFVGTILGAAWGVLVILALHQQGGGLPMLPALALALVPPALLVMVSPGYRVAPVTAAIVLLVPHGAASPVIAAADRVIEIAIGSAVALAVALALPSSRAHRLLGAAARDALTAMRQQVLLVLGGAAEPVAGAAVLALHDRIRPAIERAAAVAAEAARERLTHLTDQPDPDPLVRSLRRMSHDLVMIARTLPAPLPEPARGCLAEPASLLAAAIAEFCSDAGAALASRAPPPSLEPVTRALQAYQAAMDGLRRDRLTVPLAAADAERIFGLAFALQQLCRNLDDLAARAGDMARPRADA